MSDDIITRYEQQRVPRYTSYPTAPHFSAAVGAERYREWLRGIDPGTRLSIYLHVPFCRSMCWYCGCHTKIVAHDAPITAYLDALAAEIGLVADLLPGRMTVGHVHWGGGTPTIMAPAQFGRLMGLLRDRFRFDDASEIAVEIDPRRLAAPMVEALAAAGVTRASLGVQSFDPVVQRAVNRVQSFEQTRDATLSLRDAGIHEVNFDLLYGLPYQTVESCIDTARRALSLAPDRLSVFGYAHVPWMKPHQERIETAALPGGAERLAQFRAIAGQLVDAGYVAVGLDHFARVEDPLARRLRDGGLRRNFQGYTTDPCDTLIGFGASAIGALPQGYVQNQTRIAEYGRTIAEGQLATVRGLATSAEDRLRRDAIETVMCYQTVDLAEVARRHGMPAAVFADDLARLAPLERDGIVTIDGATITVAPEYHPLVRCVAAAFDTYLQPGAERHARAV